jgi:hypothetical protein
MMKSGFASLRGIATLTLISALGAAPALGQSAPPAPPPATVEQADVMLPSGSIPTAILGTACSDSMQPGPGILLFRFCMPNNVMQQPAAVFAIEGGASPMSREDIIRYMAEPFHERQVMRQRFRSFTVTGRPNATGLYGEFQTDLGNRYVWVMQEGPNVTRTMIMAMSRVDTDAMMREVETKIFGPLVMGDWQR